MTISANNTDAPKKTDQPALEWIRSAAAQVAKAPATKTINLAQEKRLLIRMKWFSLRSRRWM